MNYSILTLRSLQQLGVLCGKKRLFQQTLQ
jgi:hypothetical protein